MGPSVVKTGNCVALRKVRSKLNGDVWYWGTSMHVNGYRGPYDATETIVCLSVKDWWLNRKQVTDIRDFLNAALKFDAKHSRAQKSGKRKSRSAEQKTK